MGIRSLLAGGAVLVLAALGVSYAINKNADDAAAVNSRPIPLPDALEQADPELAALIQSTAQRLEAEPNAAPRWVELGLIYSANDNVQLSIECLEVAVELDPLCSPCWYHLALSRSNNGDLDGAVAAATTALDINDQYPPAHWRVGFWSLELGNTDDAEASFNRAKELDPRDPAPLVGLARVHMTRAENQQAADILEGLLEWTPTNKPYIHQLLGTTYRRLERFDDAEDMIARGTGEPSGWPDAVAAESAQFERGDQWKITRARSLIAQRKPEAAAQLLNDAIKHNPDSAALLNNLGVTYRIMSRFDESINAIRKALEIRPGYDEAHFNLGLALMLKLKSDSKAVNELGASLDVDAMKHAEEALELNPSYGAAHGLIAQVHEHRGNIDEAIAEYANASANSDGPDAVHWMHQHGRLLTQKNRAFEAIPILAQAAAQAPRHVELLFDLADAFTRVGDVENATNTLNNIRSLRPADPRIDALAQAIETAKQNMIQYPTIGNPDDG